MAGKDKPYKVYRGGRTRVPAKPIKSREDGGFADGDAKQPKTKTKRGGWRSWRRWRRIILSVVAIFLLIVIVWAVLGYLAVNRGVKEANAATRHGGLRGALARPGRSLLSNPSNILILGADVGANRKDRSGRGRSDSIMLLRTNPDDHRLSFVSIPRDLRVDIPGRGSDKINAAYAYGGTALAIETVEALTGLPVNHVIVVDFSTFNEVVDAIGGITIAEPEADPLEPVRLSAEARRVRDLGGLALQEGRDPPRRAARARLRADPREPARLVGERHHPRRAPAAGRAGDHGQDHRPLRTSCACRSSATT